MRHASKVATALASTAVLVVSSLAIVAYAGGGPTTSAQGSFRRLPEVCKPGAPGTTKRIADAKLIIEYNFTDGDIGVHGAFDDDGWKVLCVFDPSKEPLLIVGPRDQLKRLSMAGIFFESREPPIDEFSFADLRRRFPEGRYRVRGATFDGRILVGSALFTHDVPAAPDITAPELFPEPEQAARHPISQNGLRVRWGRVTQTVGGGPIEITGYEVIVTKEEFDDPHGFSQPIYDVHVPPFVTSLPVPERFLQADTVYEVEVLALERSGNQTISVGFFAMM